MRNKENLNKWQRDNYHKRKNDPVYVAKRRASARKYYHRNKDKIQIKHKKYHQDNIEKYREYRRNYRCFNPRGIYSALKDSAKKRSISIEFTVDEFVKWWDGKDGCCYYCARTINEIQESTDTVNDRARRMTIDRADNTKPYTIKNIRLACYRCNSTKGDYFTEDEMLQIGRIINAKEYKRICE